MSERRRVVRRVLGALLGLPLLSLLVVGLAYLLRLFRDLVVDNARWFAYTGLNPAKALALAAVVLVLLLAFPLALVDGVSAARFRRAERALRAERPETTVLPYEGPEGRGLVFVGPAERVLLLRPPGGLGRPRTVVAPSEPVSEEPTGASPS